MRPVGWWEAGMGGGRRGLIAGFSWAEGEESVCRRTKKQANKMRRRRRRPQPLSFSPTHHTWAPAAWPALWSGGTRGATRWRRRGREGGSLGSMWCNPFELGVPWGIAAAVFRPPSVVDAKSILCACQCDGADSKKLAPTARGCGRIETKTWATARGAPRPKNSLDKPGQERGQRQAAQGNGDGVNGGGVHGGEEEGRRVPGGQEAARKKEKRKCNRSARLRPPCLKKKPIHPTANPMPSTQQ